MRIYPHLIQPEDYPEFSTRWAKATTREALDNEIQFACLRRFTEKENKLVDIVEKLDLYTKDIEMGKVVWPFVATLLADNFEELVDEIRKRNLFLFDFWGYVPGTNTAGQSWGQYSVEPRTLETLHRVLGNRFLGTDNGEQDGRYIGAYAHMLYPDTGDRKRQYINFRDYFDKLSDDMGNFLTVLCSLNFGHYFAAMGDHIMLGAETAQALPNSNLWYAYLRGAGKQYGLLWFGNASVWNRFGWKNYTESGDEGTYQEHGPECGTSLSLLRRLMYTHYAYNCAILGFESGWFYAEGLEGDKEGRELAKPTPIGEVQHGCVKFADEHPDPGVMYTPVAIMLDFYNGWTFPRHLYTKSVYKTWGNLPYGPGDHQIHALFSMVYPGYENAGFYHDERGFLTPTPFGDAFDILFNDARSEVIGQYNLVFLSGDQRIDCEVRDKLEKFVSEGGHVILTGAHLRDVDDLSWLGISRIGREQPVTNTAIVYGETRYPETDFEAMYIEIDESVEVLATRDDLPFIVRKRIGSGCVDVIASPFGLMSSPLEEPGPVSNGADEDIPLYYDYLPAVKAYISDCFDAQKLLDIGNPKLMYTTAYQDSNHLVAAIANNGYSPEEFTFSSKAGTISAIEEWELTSCPPDTLGYFPSVSKEEALKTLGEGSDNVVESGDIGFFRLSFDSLECKVLEKRSIPDSSNGKLLSLWNVTNLREELLSHERLRQHFSGVKLEAKYLLERDADYLKREGEFFKRQKLDAVVDFIGLLNFYPDLTLIGNIESRRDRSVETIDEIFGKMRLFGIEKALFAFHRNAENNYTLDQARNSFLDTFTILADRAASRGISLCISTRPLTAKTILWNLKLPGVHSAETIEFIRRLDKPNVSYCLDTCHAIMVGEKPSEVFDACRNDIGLVAASTPEKDAYGQFYNMHGPVADSEWEQELSTFLKTANGDVPICLNSRYCCWDAVYRDTRLLNTL